MQISPMAATKNNLAIPTLPDFEIQAAGQISRKFLEKNIFTFQQAMDYIRLLPYGRNKNKNDLCTLFTDKCGTCSSKHGLLQLLAEENNFSETALVVGLFKMHAKNTPEVSATLQKHQLPYLPEAHCYLRYHTHILDFTTADSSPSDFLKDLMEEIRISPAQVSEFKVAWHKKHLADWLRKNKQIRLSPAELWQIREQCIRDLESRGCKE